MRVPARGAEFPWISRESAGPPARTRALGVFTRAASEKSTRITCGADLQIRAPVPGPGSPQSSGAGSQVLAPNGGNGSIQSFYDAACPDPGHEEDDHAHETGRHPPTVHRNEHRRRSRVQHRAPARPRRVTLRRPQRQGERRDHRRGRPGPDQRPCPLPGGGLPDHRAGRSGGGMGPLQVVLHRQVGPRAGEGGNRGALLWQNAQLCLRHVRGFPGHAREGKGHRRGPHRHARPPACVRLDSRDEVRQARVLREAAHPQHP